MERKKNVKQIRWGIVVCNDAKETELLSLLSTIHGSLVTAVVREDAIPSKPVVPARGVKHSFADAQALIDCPDVDAVYIATPPASHAVYAMTAMRAGKPVFVEAPLAASYEDCMRINRVAQETGVPCFVGFYQHYLPMLAAVEKLIEEGSAGNVLHVHFQLTLQSDCHNELMLPKGTAVDFNTLTAHVFDLLQQLFGVIVKVHGYRASADRQGENNTSACYLFETGVVGSASWSFTEDAASSVDEMKITGQSGTIVFPLFHESPIVLTTSSGEKHIETSTSQPIMLPMLQVVVEELQGIGFCPSKNLEATLTNWVIDRILGKV